MEREEVGGVWGGINELHGKKLGCEGKKRKLGGP